MRPIFGKKQSKPEELSFHETYEQKSDWGGVIKPSRGKTTDDDNMEATPRVSPYLLELAYTNEPIMHAGISLYQSFVEFANFHIFTENKINQALITKLAHTNFFETMLSYVPLHLGIYGNAYIEPLRDKNTKAIIDWLAIDPKTMHPIMKSSTNTPVVDKYGNIAYFGQGIKADSQNKEDWLRVGEDVYWLTRKQVNRTDLGLGFIEPIFQDITLKENIEQSKAQNAYRRGFPLFTVTYGTNEYKPNPAMKKFAMKIAKEIANPEAESVVIPNYIGLDFVDFKDSSKEINEALLYATRLQAAVLQMPMALLIQTGENENQSTITQLLDMFVPSFQAFQRRLKLPMILSDYFNSNGGDGDEFELRYGLLTEGNVKEQIMRLFRLSKTGLLDPADKDVRWYAKKLLGIPFIEEEATHEREEERI